MPPTVLEQVLQGYRFPYHYTKEKIEIARLALLRVGE
jgi:hypothetical protein